MMQCDEHRKTCLKTASSGDICLKDFITAVRSDHGHATNCIEDHLRWVLAVVLKGVLLIWNDTQM